MNKYRFPEMTGEYLNEAIEIYNYYVLNSTSTFHMHTMSPEEMKKLVFFDNPKYKSFIIMDNETVCGYCSIHEYSAREAYDHTAELTIYLKPGFTGKMIGGFAIDFLADWAKEHGIHALIAGICGENSASIGLFKKKGFFQCSHFKEVGKKFGKTLDVVHYEKIIS